MAAISHYLAKKLLDHVLGATAYTAPTPLLLKLYTVAPGPSGGGTLVNSSGTGYSDKSLTNNTTNFPDTVSGTGEKFLNVEQSWTATADWGTVVAWSLYDSSSNLMFFAELDAPATVNNGDTFKFAAGPSGVKITVQ